MPESDRRQVRVRVPVDPEVWSRLEALGQEVGISPERLLALAAEWALPTFEARVRRLLEPPTVAELVERSNATVSAVDQLGAAARSGTSPTDPILSRGPGGGKRKRHR